MELIKYCVAISVMIVIIIICEKLKKLLFCEKEIEKQEKKEEEVMDKKYEPLTEVFFSKKIDDVEHGHSSLVLGVVRGAITGGRIIPEPLTKVTSTTEYTWFIDKRQYHNGVEFKDHISKDYINPQMIEIHETKRETFELKLEGASMLSVDREALEIALKKSLEDKFLSLSAEEQSGLIKKWQKGFLAIEEKLPESVKQMILLKEQLKQEGEK